MGEITVVGVRTRAREALAMAEASGSSGAISNSSPGKKIKKASAITAMPYDVHELKSRRRIALASGENSSTSFRPESSSASDVVVFPAKENCSTGGEISSDFPTSCASSNDASSSGEDCTVIIADPEQVESSLMSSKNSECRSVARGENKVDVEALKLDDLDSPARHPDTKSTVQIKMPSNSEIEEFFAVAEKDIQKRFGEKYNFDIVKEVPLKGRYEWVPIKP